MSSSRPSADPPLRPSAATRARSLRFWLRWLVIACILPAAAAAAFLIVQSYQRERANAERDMVATARALMQAVDADLNGVQATLLVLAASRALAAGDLAAFHAEALAVLPGQIGSNIVVHDPSGQQLLNTLKPFGAPLPRETDMRMIEDALASGKPAVSNLFIGPATGRPVIGTSAPVRVDGQVKYLVGMGLFSDRLGEVLRRQRIPPGWMVAILDRSGTIGARTEDPEGLIGTRASPQFLARIAAAEEGSYDFVMPAGPNAAGPSAAGPTSAGRPMLGGFSRSPRTGWTIGFAVPAEVVTAGLRQGMLVNAGLSVLLLALGVVLAERIGARVTRSLDALTAPALALGSGERIAVPPVEIKEVAALGRALTRAADLIETRARERDLAETSERRMLMEKQAADDANRAKSDFLALMSHELRTPMNGILGFAQLLEQPYFGTLSDKQREFAGHILSSGRHLLDLIDDILDLSKIDAGKLSVSLERVELVPLMKSVVATLMPAAETAGIVLEAGDFGLRLPAARTDRVRLAQVLINLGANAVKYNRPGGRVDFAYAQPDAATIRIQVSDTGDGIPLDRQAELFQPFNRLGAEHRAIEGTGIGLALSRRLAELVGGTIGFSSAAGQGSRFWVDIPAHAGAEPAAESAAAAGAVHRGGFSVLYVEDNPANRTLLRHVLATLDAVTLIEAEDGTSGLALAARHRPDLIILDVNLPDLDGYEVLRRLRRLPDLAAIPVLALSAGALPSEIARGEAAGFVAYLTKPLDVRKFLEAVDAALGERAE